MKKKMTKGTKSFLIILCVIVLISVAAAAVFLFNGDGPDAGEQVRTVVFQEDNVTIEKYETYTLTLLGAQDKEIEWKSNDETVATVQDGVVCGWKKGSTQILASVEGTEVSCNVTVADNQYVPVIDLGERDSLTMDIGGTYGLKPVVYYNGNVYEDVQCTFSSTSAAVTVDENGLITAAGEGEAVVCMQGTWRRNTVEASLPVRVIDASTSIEVSGKVFDIYLNSRDEAFPASAYIGISIFDKDVPVEEKDASVQYTELIMEGDVAGAAVVKDGVAYAEKIGTIHFIAEYTAEDGSVVRSASFAVNVHESPYDIYMKPIEGEDHAFFIEPLSSLNTVEWDEEMGAYHLVNKVSEASDGRAFLFSRDYIEKIVQYTNAKSIVFEVKRDGVSSGTAAPDQVIYQGFYPDWYDAQEYQRFDSTDEWIKVEIFFDDIPLDQNGDRKAIFLLSSIEGMYIRNIRPMTEGSFLTMDVEITTLGGNWSQDIDLGLFPHSFEGSINDCKNRVTVKAGVKTTVKVRLDDFLKNGKVPGFGIVIFGGPEWDARLPDGTSDRHTIKISNLRVTGEQNYSLDLGTAAWKSGRNGTGFTNANGSGIPSYEDGTITITNGFCYDGHKFTLDSEEAKNRTYIYMDMEITTLGNSTAPVDVRFYPHGFAGNAHEEQTDKVVVTAGEKTTVKLNLANYLVDGEFTGIGIAIFGGPAWDAKLPDGTPDRHTVTVSNVRLEGKIEQTVDLSSAAVVTGFANTNSGGTAAVENGTIIITNGFCYDGHMITFDGGAEPDEPGTGTYICMDVLINTLGNSTDPVDIRFYPHGFAGNAHEEQTDRVVITAGEKTTVKLKLDNYLVDGEFTGIGIAIFGGPTWDAKLPDGTPDRHTVTVSNVRLEGAQEQTVSLNGAAVATGFANTNSGGTAAVENGTIMITNGFCYDGHMITFGTTQPQEPSDKLTVTGPQGTVYPYRDCVKEYLLDENIDILSHYVAGTAENGDASLAPVRITWNDTVDSGATKYVVEYATNADYSDAVTVVKDTQLTDKSIEVYNLYKASTYYVRVTAYAAEQVLGQAESTFQTADLGPRFMKIDGLYNVRDLGGYATADGKTTVQGLIFRGSEMDGGNGIVLTEAGNEYMSNVLGIRTDLDLRGYTTASPISSATKKAIGISAYTDAFTQKELYAQVFSTLADEDNYPVYIHCMGGADRTGTVCYLLNALLGVSEEDLIRDYEMTSYSIFGLRTKDYDVYQFPEFVEQLKSYEGDTLAEKTENYMLSIGVTEEEIFNIRAIMLGEESKTEEDTTHICLDLLINTLGNSADPVSIRFYPQNFAGNVHTEYTDEIVVTAGTETTVKLELSKYLVDGELPGIGFAVFGGPEWNTQLSPGVYDRHAITISNIRLEGETEQTVDLNGATIATGFGSSNSGGTAGITDGVLTVTGGFRYDGHMITFAPETEPEVTEPEETEPEATEPTYICIDMQIDTLGGNWTDDIEIGFFKHSFEGDINNWAEKATVTAGTTANIKLKLEDYLVDGELPGIGFAIFGGPEWNTQLSPGTYDRHTVTISSIRLEGAQEQAFDLSRCAVASGTNGTGYTNANGSGVASVEDGAIVITGGFRYDGHKITFGSQEQEQDTYVCLDLLITTLGNSTEPVEVRFYPYDFEGSVHNSYTDLVTVTAGEQTTVKLDMSRYLVDGELTGIGIAVFGGPAWDAKLPDGFTPDRHTLTVSNVRLEGAQEQAFDLSQAVVASGTNGTGYTDANGSGVASVENGAIVITGGFRYDGHKIAFGSQEQAQDTYVCLDLLITTLGNSTDPVDIRFYPCNFDGNVHNSYTDLMTVTAGEQTTVKLDMSRYLVDGELTGIGIAVFGGPEWNTQLSSGTYDRHTLTVSNVRLEGALEKTIDLSNATVATGFAGSNSGGTAAVTDGRIIVTGGFRYDGHMITFGSAQTTRAGNRLISCRGWLLPANIWKREFVNI